MEVGENIVTAQDVKNLVAEINRLATLAGVTDTLASNAVLAEQISVVNLCSDQLDPEDDLLMDELVSIASRFRAAAGY